MRGTVMWPSLPLAVAQAVASVNGYAGEEDRRKYRDAGFDRFLTRPIGRLTRARLDASAGLWVHVCPRRGGSVFPRTEDLDRCGAAPLDQGPPLEFLKMRLVNRVPPRFHDPLRPRRADVQQPVGRPG